MTSAEFWSGTDRGWRYLLQRIDGSGTPGIWLDQELPLEGVQITDVLSGPPQLSATISPRYARLMGTDGLPILTEWGSVIHAESDGVIRGSFIVVTATLSGPDYKIDASGFCGYPKGMAYESTKSFVEADPLDIVRHIWSAIQGGQNSNLGLSVDATTHTPVRVGHLPPATNPDGSPAVADVGKPVFARYFRWTPTAIRTPGTSRMQLSELEFQLLDRRVETSGGLVTAVGNTNNVGEDPSKAFDGLLATKWCNTNAATNLGAVTIDLGQMVSIDSYRIATGNDQPDRDPVSWTLEAAPNGVDWTLIDTQNNVSMPTDRNAWTALFPLKGPGSTSSQDLKPYFLNDWDTDDLGGSIDSLAKDTPFDYHERHQWDATKTVVQHFLDFGYPRIGRRHSALRFVLGENIQTVPAIDRDGSVFANHVRVMGAGEGSVMLRAEARVNDGRLRRMAIVDDVTITDYTRAAAKARQELLKRQQLTTITECVVMDTPMAPLSSFSVGDEIRIQAEADWASVDSWFRIVSITLRPEAPELIGLALIRSDQVG